MKNMDLSGGGERKNLDIFGDKILYMIMHTQKANSSHIVTKIGKIRI